MHVSLCQCPLLPARITPLSWTVWFKSYHGKWSPSDTLNPLTIPKPKKKICLHAPLWTQAVYFTTAIPSCFKSSLQQTTCTYSFWSLNKKHTFTPNPNTRQQLFSWAVLTSNISMTFLRPSLQAKCSGDSPREFCRLRQAGSAISNCLTAW